ncbi:MAG TPA: hypothetical protein VGY56_17345 [Verrucomicrobiae bacterium]|nr:hypothetical protein [Verrucomicrobiae bacterium]
MPPEKVRARISLEEKGGKRRLKSSKTGPLFCAIIATERAKNLKECRHE